MAHVEFLIWMLFYPLVEAFSYFIFWFCGSRERPSISFDVARVISLAFYLFVGYKLW